MPLSTSTRRRLTWLAVGLFIVLLSGFLTFLWKRQQLLEYALREVKTRVEAKYPVYLTLGKARFTALNTVEIKGMQLVPTRPLADTLLTARRLQASLSWRSLFAGRPVFSDLQIEAARLTARKTATGSNFGFLLKKTSAAPAPRDTALGTNYGLRLNQLLEAGFDNVPTEVNFRDFYVQYHSLHHAMFFRLPSLRIEDGDLSGRLSAKVDGEVNELGLSGHIDPSDYELTARVFGVGGSVQVPYVPTRFGALVSFDTVLVQLTGKDFARDDSGGRLVLRGSLAARHFSLYHPKLSATDIEVRAGRLDFVATLGRAAVSLDAGSRLVINQLVLHPEISVRLRPSKAVSIRVTSDETPANAFFASLPPGIFDALQGTEGSGTLQYHLNASVDMAQVDSLKFDSGLTGRNFRITRFGAEDLSQLNREFLYTAYNDRGDSLRTFPVGASNPNFTPYEEISPYLKSAITTAEDPRFFTHKGFMERAFVHSAIQNLKEHRFARGGSTISMQLVKNVFLSRRKTIGRKAEEALMVWLIENTRLVPKERMFEVYLNVIEWGPSRYRWPDGKQGIYGVKEAARFYYDKPPADLNLTESLYLASIVPKPKFARGQFNQYGELRGSTRYFFRLIADLMAQHGLISGDQRNGLDYGLTLRGPARNYLGFIPHPDTTRTVVPADSTQLEPIDLLDLLGTQ